MPGPYFKGQWAVECGCYFPDVARVRDDPKTRERVLNCIVHGEYRVKLDENTEPSLEEFIPTDEWRESERQRMLASASK